MYRAAGIDRIFMEGDCAFAFFKPGRPTLPIVLVKQDGQWRVQEALSWSLFHRFEDSMNVFLKYPLSGISVDLSKYPKKYLGHPLYPLRKNINVAVLARQGIQDSDLDSLYFKLFWLQKVSEKFSDVSKLVLMRFYHLCIL